MKQFFYILFGLISTGLFSQSSVLANDTWYKVGITESGLYKIDRNTLNALGVSSSIDPQQISIFGNGVKGILPQANAESRPEDLIENAIFISGESDGSFDQGDYILFYGIGPHKETWSNAGFSFERNIYSDTAYYFIRVGGPLGKRIVTNSSLADPASTTVSTFNDHIAFEEDELNLISSGRQWLGEFIGNGASSNIAAQVDGLSSDISFSFRVAAQSGEESTAELIQDGTTLGSVSIPSIPTGTGSIYSIKARVGEGTFTIDQDESISIQLRYNGNASTSRAYLDRYAMTFERELSLYNNETDFRRIDHIGEVVQYEVDGAGSSTIWNVSSPEVTEQQFENVGGTASFRSQSSEVEEFVVFEGSDFPSPFVFGSVGNQNLRNDVSYDGIIVTPSEWLSEANRLAQFHIQHDGLAVKVVTLTQIYNEFSSGRQDVTAIRDYAKHVYETGGTLKYLTLFGDCSYDYKDRMNSNTNFVPTYESRESFHPIFSYSSDDYFAFFDDEEGEWIESLSGDHTMEIGVGRLPVKSLSEARAVVDKIIYYCTSPNTLGTWRNEITYLADDGDSNIHARHVEDLSELVDTTYAQYKINKLLLDAFEQESGASKDLSPQTTAALKTRIKNGTFAINFIGHGNERLWTEEEVLTKELIEELTNRNKLPIFVTATCEFGRYDDPVQVSGAEDLILSENGGGIALLTTSRPVFASTNFSLNQAFHENVFRKNDGINQRLGDIIKFTKNEGLEGPVNRNFTLLGDPMMLPAFPKLDIIINELTSEVDTLSALEEVTFTGVVQNNGALQSDFNGQMVVSVYDVEQTFRTNGQESTPYSYTLRSNALFRGEALVEDGEFSFTFIVPKNISYQYEKGKISLYAWDVENNIDAIGSSRDFLIGGTEESASEDNTPPEIDMYLNDDSFVNGGVVGSSSLFIAEVRDDHGITTSRSGVVEGITLEIGEEVINLNDFYTASTASYQEGTIVYPLQDFAPGQYSATLKVWDTYNNVSSSTIDFVVTDEPTLFISNSRVYPNPVLDMTTFYFEHDREDENIQVTLVIYNSKAEVVSYRELTYQNSDRIIEIPWDAVTNSGQQLNQGIYFSRLIIRSEFDGAVKEITQKLVIRN